MAREARLGNEGDGSLVQVLAEAFVVGKEERFVAAERTSDGGAELIALERRCGALVKEVGCIESVVCARIRMQLRATDCSPIE